MDEIAKTEARNYLMAAGFFNWALMFAMLFVASAEGTFTPVVVPFATGIIGAGIGIVLIILRKRDMAGIFFMVTGMVGFCHGFAAMNGMNTASLSLVLCVMQIILSLVILTGCDRQKWLLFILPFLDGVQELLSTFFISSQVFTLVVTGIIVLVALYFSFVCAVERVSLPGKHLLTADETQDFKVSGSVLGYLMFAMMAFTWVCMYLIGPEFFSTEVVLVLNLFCSVGMLISAVLLLFVGKMRFTPVMFLLLAALLMLSVGVSGPMIYVVGIGIIVLGLYAMLRKESRILPGIMLIIYGITAFVSLGLNGTVIFPVVSVVLNIIPCMIAAYLAFAIFSKKKLPLF